MALTDQEQRFAQDVMSFAASALALQEGIQKLNARWNQNDFTNAIEDADLSAVPELAHLTKTELASAITALNAIDTALGDFTSGQAVNLIKVLP